METKSLVSDLVKPLGETKMAKAQRNVNIVIDSAWLSLILLVLGG